jgi:nucleoside 2-deoxyribosyltransferase
MSKSIYLAAPLFTLAERTFNEALCWALVAKGYIVSLPQSYQPFPPDMPEQQKVAEIYAHNCAYIQKANWLIAVCDGPDVDAGTAWEIGYSANHCRRMLIRTDFRSTGDDNRGFSNLMLSLSANAMILFDSRVTTIEEIAESIHQELVEHG